MKPTISDLKNTEKALTDTGPEKKFATRPPLSKN